MSIHKLDLVRHDPRAAERMAKATEQLQQPKKRVAEARAGGPKISDWEAQRLVKTADAAFLDAVTVVRGEWYGRQAAGGGSLFRSPFDDGMSLQDLQDLRDSAEPGSAFRQAAQIILDDADLVREILPDDQKSGHYTRHNWKLLDAGAELVEYRYDPNSRRVDNVDGEISLDDMDAFIEKRRAEDAEETLRANGYDVYRAREVLPTDKQAFIDAAWLLIDSKDQDGNLRGELGRRVRTLSRSDLGQFKNYWPTNVEGWAKKVIDSADPALFNDLDTAAFGGTPDEEISLADLRAYVRKNG